MRRTVLWCGAGLTAVLGVAALALTVAVYRPQLIRPPSWDGGTAGSR